MSTSQQKKKEHGQRKESKGMTSRGLSSSKKLRTENKEDKQTQEKTNAEVKFLSGLHLYIIPAGMMKIRVDLFVSKLTLFGGIAEDYFDPQKCTHVLVDEEMTLDRALRLLKISDQRENAQQLVCCPIVQSLWLSECLKEKKLLPVDDYLLNKPSSSSPSSSPSTFSVDNQKLTSEHIDKSSLQAKDQSSDLGVTQLNSHESPLKITLPKIYDSDSSDYVGSDDDDDDDDDDDGNRFPESTQMTLTQTSSAEHVPKQLPKGNWICFKSSQKHPNNKNQHIIEKLQEMVKTYKSTNDRWRLYSYQKAISALQRSPKKVSTWEEARSIPGIGDSLADKIWEIIESGELRKLNEFQNSTDYQTLKLFTNVWGAGSQTARIWYQLGYRTLNDLKDKATLTSQQKIGLEHYDDFLERMTRKEVAEIEKVIVENARKLLPEAIIDTCGSYRRGKLTCGDVDFLISHPDGKSHQGILSKLLSLLKKEHFITDDLIEIEENGNQRKYMGVCRLPGQNRKYRRIDIIVAPYSEYACALVHFTGSAHFNRSLRHLAKKMGMSLSEHSLRTGVIRGKDGKLDKGTILPTPTEESIFHQLGVPCRPPTERDH